MLLRLQMYTIVKIKGQKKSPPRDQEKQKTPLIQQGFQLRVLFNYFTEATRFLNVSGLFMARSASTLRSSSIPFFCNLLMNSE